MKVADTRPGHTGHAGAVQRRVVHPAASSRHFSPAGCYIRTEVRRMMRESLRKVCALVALAPDRGAALAGFFGAAR